MKRLTILLALLALSVAATARAHGEVVITITDSGFSPTKVSIETGDTVVFKNAGTSAHWPASNIHPTHTVYPGSGIQLCGTVEQKNIFDACRGLAPGETFSFTFLYPGEWRFHDHLHANFTGSIVVTGETLASSTGATSESFFSRAKEWLSVKYTQLYFALVPKAKEKRLASTDMFKVADNEAQLRQFLTLFGPKVAMAELLKDAETAPVRDCHQQAHQIGRMAYKVFGASVFAEGNTECNSGFYHGAMEAFLTQEGTTNIAGSIEKLCSAFHTGFSTFECLHGSGHGIMAYEDYDMPAALSECDHFSTDFGKRSCYGGVFMENIIAAQGLGAKKGHETKWVKQNDMQFPCNAIGDDYGKLYECYQLQTAWMLTLTNNNFPQVVANCLKARTDMIPVCFKSFGRDVAGYAVRDGNKILQMCSLVPKRSDYYGECIVGAVNVIVDYWGPSLGSQASDFCAMVTDMSAKKECDATVSERVKDLFPTGAKN